MNQVSNREEPRIESWWRRYLEPLFLDYALVSFAFAGVQFFLDTDLAKEWLGDKGAAQAVRSLPFFLIGVFFVAYKRLEDSLRDRDRIFSDLARTLDNHPKHVEELFCQELNKHRVAEQIAVDEIAQLTATLTGLNHLLIDRDFSEHMRALAEELKGAIDTALKIQSGGPPRAYSLGILTILRSLLLELPKPGLHLSAKTRTELYENVGKAATKSLLRIEPMDFWPPGSSGKIECWTEEFGAILEHIGNGGSADRSTKSPLTKQFVFLLRDWDSTAKKLASDYVPNEEHQGALSEYVTARGWTPFFLSMTALRAELGRRDAMLMPYEYEIEGHHLVVDQQVDLYADLKDVRGASGLFSNIQPALRVVFLRPNDEAKHVQRFLKVVLRQLSPAAPGPVTAIVAV